MPDATSLAAILAEPWESLATRRTCKRTGFAAFTSHNPEVTGIGKDNVFGTDIRVTHHSGRRLLLRRKRECHQHNQKGRKTQGKSHRCFLVRCIRSCLSKDGGICSDSKYTSQASRCFIILAESSLSAENHLFEQAAINPEWTRSPRKLKMPA